MMGNLSEREYVIRIHQDEDYNVVKRETTIRVAAQTQRGALKRMKKNPAEALKVAAIVAGLQAKAKVAA